MKGTKKHNVVEAIETFHSIFYNIKEFDLEYVGEGPKKSVKFNLKSDFLNNKFFENRNKNPFSFIINNDWLTFYFRINHKALVTTEIKESFELPKHQNKTEYKIYLKGKKDVIKIIELLFVKVLGVNYQPNNPNNKEQDSIIESLENSEEIDRETFETIRKALTTIRTGQQKYRKGLLDKWGDSCSVTKINQPEILKASHIKPFKDCNDYEKYDVENGLLLSPNLDTLFDQNLISFDKNGLILLSNSISTEVYQKLGVNKNMKLSMVTDGMIKYLNNHREIFENHE